MKTKKANSIVAILICLTILFTVSCDMFTNSLLKGAARDMSETMKNASTSELIASGTNPDVIGDPAAAQAAMDALADKDLSEITPEEASNVCSLASSAILPVSNLMEALDKIVDSEKNDDNESSDNSDGSQTEEESNDATQIIAEILDSIPPVNTAALEQVLGNETLVKEAEIGDVAMATVSLMASSLSKKDLEAEEQQAILEQISKNLSNISSEEIKDGVTDETIDKVLAGTAFEDDSAMKTAVKAALTLKDRDDISSLSIGGFNLGELIGVKDEENENSSN